GSQDSTATSAAQTEITQLKAEIDRIGLTTKFGNTALLDGTFGTSYALTGASTDFSAAGATAANDGFVISNVPGLPSVTVKLQAGTYDTAQKWVTEVNRAIKAALVSVGGTGGEVQAVISSQSGSNAQVALTSSGTFTVADGAGTPLVLAGFVAGPGVSSGTGGVFQVGANNSSNDRISVAIS